MKNLVAFCAIFLVALLLLLPAAQAAEFYPISSAAGSTDATDLWPVSNLIQGPGPGYDANVPHDKNLQGADGNWVTDVPGGFPSDYVDAAGQPVITLDLGQDQPLSEISLWGYSSTNANGVSEFSLRFATDAAGPAGWGDVLGPIGGLTNDDIVRQSFPLGQTVTARYVEFTALDNFFLAPGDGSGGETPGGDRIGLGEIAFAVPEPSSLLLVGLGLFLLGLRRRR